MKGDINRPDTPISGPCDICGSHVDYCDGDECDACGLWTCYECGVHIEKDWLCPECAENRQLEEEGEEDDSEPDYLELATGISREKLHADMEKLTIRAEAKERNLEEARGK